MAESGIFGFGNGLGNGIHHHGIEKPGLSLATNNTTTTSTIKENEIAELDGRHMTFEERERERRERLEGVDLATQPVRWDVQRISGGRTSADTGNTFGGGGNNAMSGTVGRITMVPPTEWYMRQQAEDEHQEQRETIHVGWSPFVEDK